MDDVPTNSVEETPLEEATPKPNSNELEYVKADLLAHLVGSILLLMAQSPTHRDLLISDLEWLVIPALASKQLKMYRGKERGKDRTVAYVSWAFLDEDAERRLLGRSPRLKPSDWNSGDRAWIVDLIAPVQMKAGIIKQLRDGPFKGREFRIVTVRSDGSAVPEVYSAESA